jgi:23S rRNA (cytidine2498-2'-O)-methyltransferase
MEDALVNEISDRAKLAASRIAAGLVQIGAGSRAPSLRFCLERQRMPDASFLPNEVLKPISTETAKAVFGFLFDMPRPWVLHAFAVEDGFGRRVAGMASVLRGLVAELRPALAGLEENPDGKDGMRSETVAVQICLAPEGLYHSVARMDRLSDRFSGGVVRMADDPLAPSRSGMKLEEVFVRIGAEPRKGQRAVDLGAAPGGWTWALVRRGCRVLAVDHGPLRMPSGYPAVKLIKHVKENGITFEPPTGWIPVDWWVCDMLVPPGVAFGLVRRWLGQGRSNRFVCNIKLPQTDPWPAIRPIVAWLESQRNLSWQVRQLYHDRREVTLYGCVMR